MIGQGLNRVAMAERLSIPQLEEAIQNKTIPAYIGIPLLEEKTQFEERMRAAQMGMNQPPQMTIADQVMQQANMVEGGIDQIPVEMELAGGGIVAFENGGDVKELMAQMTPDELALYQQTGQLPVRMQSLAPTQDMGIAPAMPPEAPPARSSFKPMNVQDVLGKTEELYGGLYGQAPGAKAPGDKMSYVQQAEDFFKAAGVNLDMAAQQAAEIASEKEALGKDREEAKKMRIIEAGFAILGGTSPNAFENIGKGATQALKGYASDIKDLQKTERELADASRQMMQAQNQIRMGVATTAGTDFDKAVERYNAANDKMAERKAGLAEKIMSDDRARQIVEAQSRSSTYEQMRADALSGDPRREAFARSYMGTQKLGTLSPALLEKEWNDMKIQDKMKYRRMGIETADQYAAYRMRSAGGGAAPAAAEEKVIDFGSIR